jgi:hypothetical protein
MLPIHLLEKMRRLGYLKEIKYIYVTCMSTQLKISTIIRLHRTTCGLLRHKKISIPLHCGMIITGRVKNEFTIRQ